MRELSIETSVTSSIGAAVGCAWRVSAIIILGIPSNPVHSPVVGYSPLSLTGRRQRPAVSEKKQPSRRVRRRRPDRTVEMSTGEAVPPPAPARRRAVSACSDFTRAAGELSQSNTSRCASLEDPPSPWRSSPSLELCFCLKNLRRGRIGSPLATPPHASTAHTERGSAMSNGTKGRALYHGAVFSLTMAALVAGVSTPALATGSTGNGLTQNALVINNTFKLNNKGVKKNAKKIKQNKKAIKKNERKIKRTMRKVRTTAKGVKANGAAIAGLAHDVAENTDTIGSLKRQQNNNTRAIEDNTDTIGSLKRQQNNNTRAIEDNTDTIGSLKRQQNNNTRAIEKNTDGVAENKNTLAQHKTAMDAIGDQADNNTAGMQANAGDIADNKTQIDANTAKTAQNMAAITQNANGVAQNAAGVADNAAGVADNAAGVADNATQIETNRQVGERNIRDIANANLEIDKLGTEVAFNSRAIGQLQKDVQGLKERDDELAAGIAAALALENPTFMPGQDVAVRVGWGVFDGKAAIGLTAAGLVAEGFAGDTSTAVVDLGFGSGFEGNSFAARGGLTVGW
ncbi:MAG: hypothetical protein AAF909_00160 [Pseudomonadota bacterium]